MKPKLTVKQARIAKGKAEGKTQRQIGREEYPNATPESAAVSVSRELKKANVQEAMQIALEKHNLTADRIAGVVNDGMNADKVTISGNGDESFAEVTPDHSIRLKAAGMAANFMGLNKENTTPQSVHFHQHIQSEKDQYNL